MFANTLFCSNIAIFGNRNLPNSRFYIFLPLDEPSLDIGLRKEKPCFHRIPEWALYTGLVGHSRKTRHYSSVATTFSAFDAFLILIYGLFDTL